MVQYIIHIWDDKNKKWKTASTKKTHSAALKLAEKYRLSGGAPEIMITKVLKNGKVVDAYPV